MSLVRQLAEASRHSISLAASAYMRDQNLGALGTALQASKFESIPGAGISATADFGRVPFKTKAGSPAFTRSENHEDVKAYLSEGLLVYKVAMKGTSLAILRVTGEVWPEISGLVADVEKSGKEVALISCDAQ